ncbi:2TM domain-containing protein [Robertkochia flava]|uniref:2TM domain-containing protein n=1 Tax=Robertkochia flava TaxID=3447986 RepID=UPI001CCED1ED|nr:2TM domain-containing protein [Robertkochia marina]
MEYRSESSHGSAYQTAKKRVNELKGFYWHLAIFTIFHAFLVLNYFLGLAWNEGFGIATVLLSFIGWGAGLAFHALKVFGFGGCFLKNWEERKIREFMENDLSNHDESK